MKWKEVYPEPLSTALAVLCVMSTCLSAYAAEATPQIQPRYVGLSSAQAYLSISSDGCAHCTATVRIRSGYNASVTMELQRSRVGSNWSAVTSWSASGSGTISLDEYYYVASGYTYRVVVHVTASDSRENFVESVSKNSETKDY